MRVERTEILIGANSVAVFVTSAIGGASRHAESERRGHPGAECNINERDEAKACDRAYRPIFLLRLPH